MNIANLLARTWKNWRKIIDEKLAIKRIMDCRTRSVHKFRTRLGFKQYHAILTKHELMVTKIMSSFEGENIQTENNFLSYRIDLYFLDYKLAMEIDENGQSDRIIDHEIYNYV